METTYVGIKDFSISVGPVDQSFICSIPLLVEPRRLTIEYVYSPAIDEAPTLPNGDPGDPPVQAELLILAMRAPYPLEFADGKGVRVTLDAGLDLRDYFTEDAMVKIELEILKQIRSTAAEAALDAYLGSRA